MGLARLRVNRNFARSDELPFPIEHPEVDVIPTALHADGERHPDQAGGENLKDGSANPNR